VTAGGPAGLVFAFAALVSILERVFNPAQRALVPALVNDPEELTAANVVSSTIESAGIFIGPALGGLLLAVTTVSVVFYATAGGFLWSALLIARIRREHEAAPVERREPGRILRSSRLIVGLYALQTLVAGAVTVLIVVSALRLLDLGQSGVGYLNSAVGVGGLLGAVVAAALIGRRRLAGDLGAGILMWGVPLVLIGLWPTTPLALAMLGVIGVANTVVDVAALTLLQRAVDDAVLARVFGVLESLLVGTIGLGSILAPLLVAGLGVRGALVATGGLLPFCVALLWTRLQKLDAKAVVPEQALELLRGIEIFAPLPAPTLERLARRLTPLPVAAGETVFREGDAGDRFYVVGAGRFVVSAGDVRLRELGPGDFFGEIALLRDVPRTATVSAAEEGELFALGRDDFLAAVTGSAASAEAADAVVGARLAGAPSRV
jgi:predicted MFS family arabinose efflux permease